MMLNIRVCRMSFALRQQSSIKPFRDTRSAFGLRRMPKIRNFQLMNSPAQSIRVNTQHGVQNKRLARIMCAAKSASGVQTLRSYSKEFLQARAGVFIRRVALFLWFDKRV